MVLPILSGTTRLVPILAHPIDHVRAPEVYNPAFAAEQLDWCMVPMGVTPADLAATMGQLARVSNLQGLNLTIPHKAAAHALCRRLGPLARHIGTVNTLRLEPDGVWAGENFDGLGFVSAAQACGVLDIRKPVVVVGSGGAGMAIAFALAGAGVKTLDLLDIDVDRVQRLRDALRLAYPGFDIGSRPLGLLNAGLAVNATPLGLHRGDPMPFDVTSLPADAAVFDIIAARDTELMACAQARGLSVVGGRPMIEHQLAAQIAFWRGSTPVLEISQ